MEKIIDGKRYNTATAQEIGRKENTRAQFVLYRKNNGGYFVYGKHHTGAENIKPLTPDGARQWAYNHLPVDQYKDHFGLKGFSKVEKVTKGFRLSKYAMEKLRRYAAANNKEMSHVIEDLILKKMEDKENEQT